MRKTGYLLAQNLPICTDVRSADLEQVVEAACDHMAFLYLRDAQYRVPELVKRFLARVAQLNFGKRDVTDAQLRWIGHRAKAANIALINQAPEADLTRCLRQAYAACKLCDCHAAIGAQLRDDLAVDLVELAIISHNAARFALFRHIIWSIFPQKFKL